MQRLGLIDIGSNTIRLVIFEFNVQQGLNDILNIKTPARLSQYLDDTMRLSDEGFRVLQRTLKSFKKVAQTFEVRALDLIATAALRQSSNVDEIVAAIHDTLNLNIQVISEEDEAFYGYYAITHTTEIQDGISIDIGGGSTEITLFKNKKLVHAHSFPFGVVTLKQQFFDDDAHNDPEAIQALESYVRKQLSQLPWLQGQHVALIGIGGSARNIARIHQAQHAYPISGVHNYTMNQHALSEVAQLLQESSKKALRDLDGLSRDRADIITPAAIVFNTLFSHTEATQFTFSRKGLREGYIMAKLNQEHSDTFDADHVSDRALIRLANEYQIDSKSASHRLALCEQLLQQLIDMGHIEVTQQERWLFLKGAYLYYLGRFIDSDSSSPHTYYIIANSNIDGLTHHERVCLALLASFKNKSLLKFYSKQTDWLEDATITQIQRLGGIIKFIHTLNISHTSDVTTLHLEREDDKNYLLVIECHTDPVAEIYHAQRQKKHIEKILKANLTIKFTNP